MRSMNNSFHLTLKLLVTITSILIFISTHTFAGNNKNDSYAKGIRLCYQDYEDLSSFTKKLLENENKNYNKRAVTSRNIRMCGNVIMDSKKNGVKLTFKNGDVDLRYVLEACYSNSRNALIAMSREMAIHYGKELTSKKQVNRYINEMCGIALIQAKSKKIKLMFIK